MRAPRNKSAPTHRGDMKYRRKHHPSTAASRGALALAGLKRSSTTDWGFPTAPTATDVRRKGIGGNNLAPALRKKRPASQAGQTIQRFISTSTPGRRSLRISTSGSRTRRRSSIVTSGSRTPFPTVTSGVRVQFSPHNGPTQFRSHTSAALAGSKRMAELVSAATQPKRVYASGISMIFSTHINAR